MQQKNSLVFIVLSMLVLFGWIQLNNWLNPPKQKAKQQEEQKVDADSGKPKPPAATKILAGSARAITVLRVAGVTR